MSWKARLDSVSQMSTASDSLDLWITYYDDAVPAKPTITKQITYHSSTQTVSEQLLNLKAMCDEVCLRLTRQDALKVQLDARVGTVVSS